MKRPLTKLSALYEIAVIRMNEAWAEAQPIIRKGEFKNLKFLRKHVLCMRRCEILKGMIKASIEPVPEEDYFDEPLPARACDLDDESCEACS